MSELPVPFGLNEESVPNGTIKVQPVVFSEKTFGPYEVEFAKNGNKLVFHFYKNGVFSLSFRSRLYNAFTQKLNFNGRESELLAIDWIQEFDSWCVVIKNVLEVSPPPTDSLIEETLDLIFS